MANAPKAGTTGPKSSAGRVRMVMTVTFWRALPLVSLLVACLFVLPRCPWPRASAWSDRGAAASPLTIEPWQRARQLLDEASVHRRNGDWRPALELYRTVQRTTCVRAMDRDRAAYWQARLRVEQGEQSALLELENWVRESRDPMLLARTAQLAKREALRTSSSEWVTLVNSLYSAAIDALKNRSAVHDENGERAKRWLDRLSE